MTKQQEIARFRSFAKELVAAGSYGGEWVTEQLPFIEAAISSDMPLGSRALTMKEAEERGAKLIKQAEDEAKRIVYRANSEAEVIRKQADTQSRGVRSQLAADLRKALVEIGG